ncbi:MAG TPA: TonB family protein [Phycisphaerales bacterium]|nr:TonB family protein [Phycisphaerales bacterium]
MAPRWLIPLGASLAVHAGVVASLIAWRGWHGHTPPYIALPRGGVEITLPEVEAVEPEMVDAVVVEAETSTIDTPDGNPVTTETEMPAEVEPAPAEPTNVPATPAAAPVIEPSRTIYTQDVSTSDGLDEPAATTELWEIADPPLDPPPPRDPETKHPSDLRAALHRFVEALNRLMAAPARPARTAPAPAVVVDAPTAPAPSIPTLASPRPAPASGAANSPPGATPQHGAPGANDGTPGRAHSGVYLGPAPHSGNKAPKYPDECRRRKEQGTAHIRVAIEADGSVSDAMLVRSSGFQPLDEAALAAVRDWRFTPAKQDGAPIASEAALPIIFRLKE